MQQNNPRASTLRHGAVSTVLATLLLGGWAALIALSGSPTTGGGGLASWVAVHALTLALANELLFFGSFALVPGVVALTLLLWRSHPVLAVVGGSALAASIATLFGANVFLGRLVYPVFGLELGPDALALAVSAYFGAVHAADLLFAIAVLVQGLALWRGRRGVGVLVLALVAFVAEVVVAYPWLLQPAVVFGLRLALWAWFLVLAVLLGRGARQRA